MHLHQTHRPHITTHNTSHTRYTPHMSTCITPMHCMTTTHMCTQAHTGATHQTHRPHHTHTLTTQKYTSHTHTPPVNTHTQAAHRTHTTHGSTGASLLAAGLSLLHPFPPLYCAAFNPVLLCTCQALSQQGLFGISTASLNGKHAAQAGHGGSCL